MSVKPNPETPQSKQSVPFNPVLLVKLEGTTGPILSLDWSPDSRMLAWAAMGQIKLWDAVLQKETAIFQAHTHDVWGLAWSPDGLSLASASPDGSVKLWHSTDWQETANLLTGAMAFCASWSPDRKHLAVGTLVEGSLTGTYSGKSQLWDTSTHQPVRELDVSAAIISIAWSPDGHTIAVGQWDGKIILWNGEKGTALRSLIATSERSDVNGLAWSPDGRMLASAHQDGKVRVWNPETGEILKALEGHKGMLRGVTWSPDGKMLASADENAEIRVWQIDNGQLLACFASDSLPIWSLKWSPDGNWLAAGNGILLPEPIDTKVFIYKMPVGPRFP